MSTFPKGKIVKKRTKKDVSLSSLPLKKKLTRPSKERIFRNSWVRLFIITTKLGSYVELNKFEIRPLIGLF